MRYLIFCMFACAISGLVSCTLKPESPQGFSLPDGNSEGGKLVLLKYKCLSCHIIDGLEPPVDLIDLSEFSVRLGEKSHKVKTYADLLTSIINPSHKFAAGYKLNTIQSDGVSKMPIYNDVMTVTELVNLVTFLQSNYVLIPYKKTDYQQYEF